MAFCPDANGLRAFDILYAGEDIPGFEVDPSRRQQLIEHLFIQIGKHTAAANFKLSEEAREAAQTSLTALAAAQPEINELAFWARRHVDQSRRHEGFPLAS